MARNCGATSRSAAARISAIASRRISGGGIEIECVTPLSSVSRRCSSVLSVGRPIPDHVVAAVAAAQIVVRPGHRIAEELLAGRQAERHVLEQLAMDRGRNGLLRQQRAPGDVAGIERVEVGQELLAHGRADAVGADQQIGLHAAAVAEMRHHRSAGLLEALQPDAAVIVLGREGVAQDAIEPLPGGQRLRTFDLADDAALGIEDLAGRHLDAEIGRCRCRARAASAAPPAGRRCRRRGRTARCRPARRSRPRSRAGAAAGPRTGRSSSRRSRWPVLRPICCAASAILAIRKIHYIVPTTVGGMPWL